MSLLTRAVAGEALAPHIGRRLDSAPVASSGLLLTRLGMGNPWATDGEVGARAAARATREARLDERLHRFDRAPIRAGRRMWPGESRRFSFSGMHLSESSMVFPWMPLEDEVEEEEVETGTRRARRPRGPGMRPVSNAWHSVNHAPARVIRGGGRRQPAQRTTRVSRGGRVRFEPTPRRASRNVAQTGELAGSVESRSRAPVSTGERRARDLVRDSGPARSERRVSVTRRSSAVPVQFQAGFQAPATRTVERQARRRPMDRLGDRVAAVLGPVRAAAAASRRAAEPIVRSSNVRRAASSSQTRSTVTRASGTQRSVGVRTQSPSSAPRSAASRGTAASAEPPAGESARSGFVEPTLAGAGATLAGGEAVEAESVADRTVQRWSDSESAPSRSARSRVARARAAVERAVLGPALARAAQSTLTRHLDDGDVRPLALAAGRATQSRERRRGLRPVFRHSPMMSVVEPELAEDAAVEEVAPTPTRAPRDRQGPRVIRGFGSTGDVQRSSAAAATSNVTPSSATPPASGGVSNRNRTGAGSSRRVSGTRWLAERIQVGTATDGSFRPAVMTRPSAPSASVAAATSPLAAPGEALRASGSAIVDVQAPRVERAAAPHAASVFRRMETGQVVPGSTLPVPVPRRARTGQGRALFVSVPEAIVPQAPVESGHDEEVPSATPSRRPTVSPRVVRSSDQVRRAAETSTARGGAAPAGRSSGAPAASRSARAGSGRDVAPASTAAPSGATRRASGAGGSASVMDFGTISAAGATASSRAASVTGPKSTRPTERVASKVQSTVATSSGASSARRGANDANQTPFGPIPVGTGVVPEPAPQAGLTAAPAPAAARDSIVSRTAVRSAGLSSVHRAAEIAANRARPLERSRSLLPRRPRMAGEATAERASFAPSMSDGRPVVSAASRMSRAGRRAPGTRLVDDAALVTAPEQQDLEAAESTEVAPAARSRASSPRVIRSGTRVQRLAEQAGRAASDGTPAGASPQAARGRSVGSPMQQAALRGGKAAVAAGGDSDGASPDVKSPSVRSSAAGPTAATVAFARSARSLAGSTNTPARVSSVLHAAARAALEGKPDTVERLLRVADSAARREEAAASLMPKVAPRHGSRAPSMWSALRSPVDSAVAVAAAGVDETAEDSMADTPTRGGRSQSTVPVVRSGRRNQAATARRTPVVATVKAARRSVASPVTSGTARSVLRSAPPAVRARVKALLSRRSRPSALGYARLADVDEVLQAVTQAFSEAGATADGAPRVEAVRDAAGRRRLSNARKQAMANGAKASLSRPSDWAGARTASAVTDPDPRVRRAVSSMSVFRTALGEFTVPVSMDATTMASGAGGTAGSRQGRHVLRTADGRFVSPTRGAAAPATARTAAESRSETRVARSAYGVDTDTVVSQPDGVDGGDLAPGMSEARATSGRAAQNGGSSRPGAGVRGSSGQYRNRPGLQSTLGEVDEHSSARHELPVWARRASGSPLVRSSEQRDVMRALARAHTPEQVVQVIAQHGAELGSVPASLPAPVLQVIEQVREGARQDLEARYMAAQEASRDAESGRTRSAPTPRRTQSAEPELLKAVRGLKKRQASRSQSGVGDDRVMKLARKLQSLIHLAEGTGDRDEARRHVRMAENSAAARAEGQGAAPGSNKESGKNKQVDIESLITEVVQSVNRELALRRERRQEDPDGGSWW